MGNDGIDYANAVWERGKQERERGERMRNMGSGERGTSVIDKQINGSTRKSQSH